jgi:hypothetical protein
MNQGMSHLLIGDEHVTESVREAHGYSAYGGPSGRDD